MGHVSIKKEVPQNHISGYLSYVQSLAKMPNKRRDK